MAFTRSKYYNFDDFFSELAHCSSIFPNPPQFNVMYLIFFECSHSWILKICATYYLGYQTDLVKKNLYMCRGTFIVIRSTWMSELLYYIPITTTTTYYYISVTSLLNSKLAELTYCRLLALKSCGNIHWYEIDYCINLLK